jgi:hypothetical protein
VQLEEEHLREQTAKSMKEEEAEEVVVSFFELILYDYYFVQYIRH